MDGETYGFELSASWSVKPWWRLTGGYTWFRFNERNKGNSQEARQGFSEDENAEHRFSLLSYMDLPNNFELNFALYYVDEIPELGFAGDEGIDSNVRLDINLSYHATDNWSFTAGGRNLFNDGTKEYNDTMDGIVASEIPRIVYTSVTYKF